MELLVMLGIGLAILLAVAVTFVYVAIQDARRAKERIQSEREIAQQRIGAQWQLLADREQEQAFQTYEEDLSALLLSGHLQPAQLDHEIREVAQARTLAVLPELDTRRKGFVLRFLHEAGLIDVKYPIIDLAKADLSKIMMAGADLHEAMLNEVDLHEAQLHEVTLRAADLSCANMYGAHLTGADLLEANLTKADLRKADLRGADLTGASLVKADLMDADLTGADLSEANLSDAKVLDDQLKTAKSLKGAIMPNEKIYYVFLAP